MIAKELRIGNIVLSAGQISEVKMINGIEEAFDQVYLEREHDFEWTEFDRIEGIELTPIWIERLGFSKTDDHEMGYFTDSKFDFYYDYHFKILTIVCGNADVVEVSLDHIKTIHQIQNLVHILTGTELEIKL